MERAKKREAIDTRKEMLECKLAVKAIEKDDKLKRPMSGYFMWLNDNRQRIMAALGGKGGPAVTKRGAEEWKALAEREKRPYEDRAKKAKEEYEAYIATAEGAAALKAYKEAAAAVAYKPKVLDGDDRRRVQQKRQERKHELRQWVAHEGRWHMHRMLCMEC